MENSSHNKNSFVKKLFLTAFAFIALFVLVLGFLAILFSDKINQLVIAFINKNLNAEVTIGKVDFSLLRNFPYATVNFTDVVSKERKDFDSDDTLLVANNLSLLFNITDLIGGKYILKKIVLSDAKVNLMINKDGKGNYVIWQTDTASSGEFRIELEKVLLENVLVSYKSESAEQDYLFRVNEGAISAVFTGDKISITGNADLLAEHLISEGVNFVKKKNAALNLILKVDNGNDSYVFESTLLKIAGIDLTVNGTIISKKDFSDYHLSVNAYKANLKSLLSVIPDDYSKNINKYLFSGKANFDLSINGKSGKWQNPVYSIHFGTNNSTISPKKENIVLKEVRFKGFYTSRKSSYQPVSYLSLKNLNAVLNGRKISVNLEIENFKNPLMHFNADASADLASLSRFIKPDKLEFIHGDAEIRNAEFSGKLNDVSTYVSSGNIHLRNVSLKLKGKPAVISEVETNLSLNKNNLQVNSLSGKTKSSDFVFTGTLENFFGYFFGKNQKLNMNVALQSSHLDLNEILEKENTTASDTVYKIRFADDLLFSMNLNVQQLHFNKFNSTGVTGIIKLNHEQLTTEALKFEAMDGSVSLQGSIRELQEDSLEIQYDADVKNLNITKLFYEMGNFGQEVITDKNLKGNVTANVQFVSRWSNKLNCNTGKVRATSAVTIENGELLNFAPMLALSRYVKGANLNDIKFSTLKNSIEIKNRMVIIPAMEIKSTALDISASGTHSFDNIIDYHLQLLLSQLLGKKVKNLNTEFGTIEDDNLGRTKIFITMKGPAASPKISYDSKGLKEKIYSDIKKEREILKEILKKEFGRKDSFPEKMEKQKQQELEIDTSED